MISGDQQQSIPCRGIAATALAVALTILTIALQAAPAAAQQASAAGQQEGAVGADTAGDSLRLDLDRAVELALRHNLQLRVQALEPEIADEEVRFARGEFDPVFLLELPRAFTRSASPQASVLGGADVLSQEQVTTGFRFGQDATSLGTSWSVSGSLSRFVTNNAFSTFNPRYDTQIGLQVRQPLLRGFGRTVNRSRIRVAALDERAGREQFRATVQDTVLQVVRAYWELVRAERNLDIARESLRLARDQLQRNNAMVRIGVLAGVDVIQTEQQVADAELTVLQAEIQLQDRQDQLRGLLNLEAARNDAWDLELVATTEPVSEAPALDLAAAEAEAMESSPLVQRDRLSVAGRTLEVQAAQNALLPQLDLNGNIRLDGLGGDQIFRSGSPFGGSGVVEIQEGGLSDSLRQLLSGDFRSWSVGLSLSFPVGNQQARARFAQATIRERQAETRLRDSRLQARLRVRAAARNVLGGARQVAAAQEALALAERQYAAELRRFETGTSNTFQVLSFQRQLTLARQRRLNALIALNIALAEFDWARGALLRRYGVEIAGDAANGMASGTAGR